MPIDFHEDHRAPGYLDPGPLWPYLSMVGTGMIKDATCLRFRDKVAFCGDKPGEHLPILIPDTCGRRACPECWTTWADRAGVRVRDQLNGYLTARWGLVQGTQVWKDLRYLFPRHVSFHPPRAFLLDLAREILVDLDDIRDFQAVFHQRFRERAIPIMLEAGCTGGLYIPHDIRLIEDRDVIRADNEIDTDRYREVLDRPDWRDLVKWWPHPHGIVFGKLEDARSFHLRTGWTYRVHRVVSSPGPLIRYLLSHSIAPEGIRVHAIVPFGDMKRLDKMGEYRCRRPVLCAECADEGKPDVRRHMGTILQGSLFCEHDLQISRVRSGRGRPEAWVVQEITAKQYTKVQRRGVFNLRDPGEKRPPKSFDVSNESWRSGNEPRWKQHVHYLTEEEWGLRETAGQIPGCWFEFVRGKVN